MPLHRFVLSATVALTLACQSGPLQAAGLTPVALAPIQHQTAQLTLILPNGEEVTYSPAELEEMRTFELTTRTPWREEPAVFQGIRLNDLLERHGLDQAASISVRAENDYTITMERGVWQSEDFLIATRVDGKPHSRRARGPIQFVLDWDAYQASDIARESHLVWMASEITITD